MDTSVMQGTSGARYQTLSTERDSFLQRARRASKLTIPALIPPDGHSSASQLPTPFQSLGARGVNNLCSKLLLTLLPPNAPFFRLVIDDYALQELGGDDTVKAEVEASLAKIEKAVMSEIETSGMRPRLFEALKHTVVGGNALLFLEASGKLRVFPLDSYVVDRDPNDNLLEVIIHEKVSAATLKPELYALIKDRHSAGGKPDDVDLYTHAKLANGRWMEHQELCGVKVPNSDTFYPEAKFPYVALRWNYIAGEAYGRGMVEEYEGDLISLEGLSESIVQGSAASARGLILVNPNGVTRQKDVAGAANWAVIPGTETDVTVLQAQKSADLNVAAQTADTIRQELSKDFLLNSSVIRNAERVTTVEIRFIAQEIEDTLGGVYSLLSGELQLPLVTRLLDRLRAQGRIPAIPDSIKPQIVTGLDALGRGHELNQLDVFITGASQQLGPEVLAQYLNAGQYLLRRANALGMNTKGLIRSEEEVQAAMQAAQQQAMVQQAIPTMIDAGAKAMTQTPTA